MNPSKSEPELTEVAIRPLTTDLERYQHLREMVAALLWSSPIVFYDHGLKYHSVSEVAFRNLERAYGLAPYGLPQEQEQEAS